MTLEVRPARQNVPTIRRLPSAKSEVQPALTKSPKLEISPEPPSSQQLPKLRSLPTSFTASLNDISWLLRMCAVVHWSYLIGGFTYPEDRVKKYIMTTLLFGFFFIGSLIPEEIVPKWSQLVNLISILPQLHLMYLLHNVHQSVRQSGKNCNFVEPKKVETSTEKNDLKIEKELNTPKILENTKVSKILEKDLSITSQDLKILKAPIATKESENRRDSKNINTIVALKSLRETASLVLEESKARQLSKELVLHEFEVPNTSNDLNNSKLQFCQKAYESAQIFSAKLESQASRALESNLRRAAQGSTRSLSKTVKAYGALAFASVLGTAWKFLASY